MNRIRIVLVAAAALLAACGGDQALTPSASTPPNAQIVDGANSGGNRDFFFLSPLVANPSGKPGFKDDAFNPSYSPIVEICPLTAGAITDANNDGRCDNPVPGGVFSGAQISVSTTDEQYSVNWNTGASSLNLAINYRIRVLIGNVELGYADVDPMNAGKMKNETTGDLIPLVDGRTLPIKFRIEVGALTTADDLPTRGQVVEKVVTNNGNDADGQGTVVLSDPTNPVAGGFFPDGWLTGQPVSQVIVTIEEIPVAVPAQCHTGSAQNAPFLLQFGKCIRYSTVPRLAPLNTTGAQFAQGVVVGFCRDLPTNAPNYEGLRVWQSETGEADTPRNIPPRIYQPYFLLSCDPIPPTVGGVLGRLQTGWRTFASAVGRVLGPSTAYAVDLGIGGEAFSFSDFDFGMIPFLGTPADNPTTAPAGAAVPNLRFRVWAAHSHGEVGEEPDSVPVAGIQVNVTRIAGQATLGTPPAGGWVSDANGTVTIPLTMANVSTDLVILEARVLAGVDTLKQVIRDTITLGAPPPITLADLNRVGDSTIVVGDTLVLTARTPAVPGNGGASAAWSQTRVPLATGFSTTFTFRITDPNAYVDPVNPTGGGDGFAFVIQNVGTSALGEAGGGLGYSGIPSSLAIEFDTWDDDAPAASGFDLDDNHIAIHTLGASPNSHTATAQIGDAVPPTINMSDGQPHTVRIVYTAPPIGSTASIPGSFNVYLDNLSIPILTRSLTIPAAVLDASGAGYVGFTAATGAAMEKHKITNWSPPGSTVVIP